MNGFFCEPWKPQCVVLAELTEQTRSRGDAGKLRRPKPGQHAEPDVLGQADDLAAQFDCHFPPILPCSNRCCKGP